MNAYTIFPAPKICKESHRTSNPPRTRNELYSPTYNTPFLAETARTMYGLHDVPADGAHGAYHPHPIAGEQLHDVRNY